MDADGALYFCRTPSHTVRVEKFVVRAYILLVSDE